MQCSYFLCVCVCVCMCTYMFVGIFMDVYVYGRQCVGVRYLVLGRGHRISH